MCGPVYKEYECGCRILAQETKYCRDARISAWAGRLTKCGLCNTTTNITKDKRCDLCSYKEDLARSEWKCYEAEVKKYYCRRVCEGLAVVNRRERKMKVVEPPRCPCWHC